MKATVPAATTRATRAAHAPPPAPTGPFALAARFETEDALLAAAKAAYLAGYRRMDALSPIPVEGLAEALGQRKTIMPLIILLGGIAGGLGGFFMQWYSMVVDYPYNIGGRPFNSWPSFIPVTFELTVLCAAVSGVIGMLFLNGLPRLHHPVFAAPGIERATVDQFFLYIESADPKWDAAETRRFFETEAHAAGIVEVPRP